MRRNIVKPALSRALAFAALAALAATATAEPAIKHIPDAERGEAIVRRLCVNCHVVSKDAAATIPEGVPTFHAIANDPGQTWERIRGALVKPHTPMPDMHLSRNEIDDIIAYINRLREPGAGPSLLRNGNKPEKYVYPDAG